MVNYTDTPASSEGSAEIGPAPYFHPSDCNICRQQDGLKTGSALLDGPARMAISSKTSTTSSSTLR
jgi:hypothetical protein